MTSPHVRAEKAVKSWGLGGMGLFVPWGPGLAFGGNARGMKDARTREAT